MQKKEIRKKLKDLKEKKKSIIGEVSEIDSRYRNGLIDLHLYYETIRRNFGGNPKNVLDDYDEKISYYSNQLQTSENRTRMFATILISSIIIIIIFSLGAQMTGLQIQENTNNQPSTTEPSTDQQQTTNPIVQENQPLQEDFQNQPPAAEQPLQKNPDSSNQDHQPTSYEQQNPPTNQQPSSTQTQETPTSPQEQIIETLNQQETHDQIILGKEVKWTKKVIKEKEEISIIKVPKEAKKVSLTKKENAQKRNIPLSGLVSMDVKLDNQKNIFSRIFSFFKNLFQKGFTGEVVEGIVQEYEQEKTISLDSIGEYEITYFTPAPQATEEIFDNSKKIVTISGPELNYQDILSFTSLPEILTTEEKNAIKVFWIEEKRLIDFQTEDTNNNGLIDRITWNTPHLSNQSFEISITVLNIQSYPAVGNTWTVEFATIGTADLTIKSTKGTWSSSDNTNLRFLNLKCGDNLVNYSWIGNQIFIKDYSCPEISFETSLEQNPGNHILEFTFGNLTKEAYNHATGPMKLYLNNTQTSSPCPTTNKKLDLSYSNSRVIAWPGDFDRQNPGSADAGQFLTSQTILNTTLSTEIANPSQTTRNSLSFGQGWLYDADLAGYRIETGNFIFNLSVMGGQMAASAAAQRIFARASIVSCNSGNFTYIKDLFQTNCLGGTCSGGQTGWRANEGTRLNHPGVNSIINLTFIIQSANNHTFSQGEMLFLELGFGDAATNPSRTIGLIYNTQASFVTTPNLSRANRPAVINTIFQVPNIDLIENNNRSVQITFMATDQDGVADINESTAFISANISSENISSIPNSCTKTTVNITSANITCLLSFPYYSNNGTWSLKASINDSLSSTQYLSQLTVNLLSSIEIISSKSFSLPTMSPESQNISSTSIIIKNTGNKIGNLSITAFDLHGATYASEKIEANKFAVASKSENACLGTSLQNNSEIIIPINLPKSPSETSEIYICLKSVPNIIAQDYSTTTPSQPWIIRIFLVSLIPVRKRKKIRDNKKEQINISTKESLNQIEKLSQENNLSLQEIIIQLSNKKDPTSILIPLSIFSKSAGILESLCKYLKEKCNMRYSEIASVLERDERTIWTSYNKAIKKANDKITTASVYIPLNELKNKELSIFESLVIYLRKQNYRYSEIALFLNRDERNIWTTYKRAEKKVKT